MLFLRVTLIIISILGFLSYLISIKIRSEFLNIYEAPQSLFGRHSAEIQAFCKKPPNLYVSKLLKLHKKLSVALIIFFIAFLLGILSVNL